MDDYPTRADEVRKAWKQKEKPVTPIERLRALEKAVELVAKATPGPWRVDDTRDDIEVVGRPARKCKRYGKAGEWAVAKVEDQDFDFDTTGLNSANAIAIASAVNFIREHGSALIAELGQEVGAVAPDARFPDDGNGDDDAYNKGWNDCRAFTIASKYANPPPAHTSEARDAARLEWLWNDLRLMDKYNRFQEWDRVANNYRDAIDAAMRQEGGSDA